MNVTSLRRATGADVVAGDSATRVLLAIMSGVYLYPELQRAFGSTRSTLNFHLRALRAAGLVDWDPTLRGSIHALVHPAKAVD